TDEEAVAFERQTLERNNADRRRDTAEADVAQAYNDAWYDRGTKTVGTRRSSLIVEPPGGMIPPLTSAAQARTAAPAQPRPHPPPARRQDPLPARSRRPSTPGPPLLPGPYNNNLQIVQTREYIAIANEMIHDTRIVPMDGRPHLPPSVRRWQGDPRGHWE